LAAALQLVPDDADAKELQKQAEAKLAALGDREKRQAAFNDLLDRGKKSVAAKRFNEGIASLEAALRLIGDDREAQRALREAKESLKKAKAANAKLLAAADAAVRLGRFEEAVRSADEAVKNWAEDSAAEKALRNAERLLQNVQANQLAYQRYMQQAADAMAASS